MAGASPLQVAEPRRRSRPLFHDWTAEPSRHTFVEAESDWDRTPAGHDWDQTPSGHDWDQTPAGHDWDRTPSGHVSDLVPAASEHPQAPASLPARRTITITGHGADRTYGVRRRDGHRHRDRGGHQRPDRIAMWAVLLGIALAIGAATSSHAATLSTHALLLISR